MAEPAQRRWWLRFRKIFRWCRISVLLVICLFCFGLLWLNYVGLPAFAREKIVVELRRNNVDLDFKRLRLRGFVHIIADKVRLKTIRDPLSPRFSADRAEFHLDGKKLVRLDFQLEKILFQKGSLILPLATNSEQGLVIENVQAAVSFPVPDHISIDELQGQSLGMRFAVGGYIFNASEFTKPKPAQKPPIQFDWRPRLAEVITELSKIDFPEAPELQLQFSVDGKAEHPMLASADLQIKSASAEQTRFQNGTIHFELNPSEFTNTVNLSARAELFKARSEFAKADHALLLWGMDLPIETNGVFRTKASFEAESLMVHTTSTPYARLDLILEQSGTNLLSELKAETTKTTNFFAAFDNANVRVLWTNGPVAQWLSGMRTGETNALEASAGAWDVSVNHPSVANARSEEVQISGSLLFDPTKENGHFNPQMALRSLTSSWKAEATNLFIKNVEAGKLRAEGSWEFPKVRVGSLKTDLYEGHARASVELNIETLLLDIAANGDFDYHKISPLLDPPVARWLDQFGWDQPPKVQGTISFILPRGAKSWSDWEEGVMGSLEIAGDFAGAASVQGILLDWAQSHFHFTNYIWKLPDLELRRSDGSAKLEYEGNIQTLDYHWLLDSHLHPGPIKSLFDAEQREMLDMMEFDEAPEIQGEIWGNWEHPERIGFSGKVRAKNFWVQDEKFSDIEARVRYTNVVITCEDVIAHREQEEATVERLQIFPLAGVMWVTNGVSTMNPYVAMKLVGPEILRVIMPYQFPTPPRIKINGAVPLGDPRKADLHFDLAGENFSFWKFHMPTVTGNIYWKGLYLDITNVQASFYTGRAGWEGHFFFPIEKDSADYSFQGTATNVDLKLLMRDLQDPHTKLEGVLNGTLAITSANSDDWKSWNGYGRADLKDGFLWDVPVFGIFTKALEAVTPGLAVSRVTAGTADFQIKNSIISSKNLELRAPAFRLHYQGQVDFGGTVDAKVEALLLRDTWMFGKLFSTVLWPVSKVFEAKITGTLNDPKTKLKHFPKVVSAPFRAMGAVKDAIIQKGEQQAQPAAAPKTSQ
jgi:hypothetical protein